VTVARNEKEKGAYYGKHSVLEADSDGEEREENDKDDDSCSSEHSILDQWQSINFNFVFYPMPRYCRVLVFEIGRARL
jgi:hypothetical protein